MVTRYGGKTPDAGLRTTLEAPTGTDATTPVVEGALYKISGNDTSGDGYKMAALADGDDPTTCVIVQAEHGLTAVGPVDVLVLGPYSKVAEFPYLVAELPVKGHSIQISATVTKVGDLAWAHGKGYVLRVDTVAEICEVLI